MGKSALPTVNNYEGFFLFKGVYLLLEFSLDLVNWQVQMWVKLTVSPHVSQALVPTGHTGFGQGVTLAVPGSPRGMS